MINIVFGRKDKLNQVVYYTSVYFTSTSGTSGPVHHYTVLNVYFRYCAILKFTFFVLKVLQIVYYTGIYFYFRYFR